MLKIKLLPGFMLIAATIWAQTSAVRMEHGSTVINHTNKSGPKVTFYQTVLIDVETWLNDSLVQSTLRDNGGPREFTIPDSIAMQTKVPAVFEALFYMANGDSATVFQPVDSIMAKGIPEEFGVVKQIRFEVRIADILTPEKIAARAAEEQKKMETARAQSVEVAALMNKTLADYNAKKLGDKLQKTASGLEYIILEKGAGAAIKEGDDVTTHYYGVLKADGTMFDNSFDRGSPVPFTVGSLIPGFNEGMKLLNKGGKAIIFIPPGLGYGEEENGPIPANSDLVFYIVLE